VSSLARKSNFQCLLNWLTTRQACHSVRRGQEILDVETFFPRNSLKIYLACKTNFYFTQVLHTSLKYLFLDGIIDTNDENINYNA